jgi:predicted methyltransferase
MSTNPSLVERAHELVREHLSSGDIAIDATVGNGHDTLFLAQAVGTQGKVYGFDIQQDALDSCYHRLAEHNADKQVSLNHAGHETLPIVIPEALQHGKIKAVMFNLGYLPGGDKQRTTQSSTTLSALDSSLPMLCQGGIITILAYTGHPGGKQETEIIKAWASTLDTRMFSVRIETRQQGQRPSPELIVINKLLR